MIFLSETRGSSHSIDSLKNKWGLNGIGVSSVGQSGGLALLWRKNFQITPLSYSKYHIDATMNLEEDSRAVRITGIYEEPDSQQRHLTWNLLHNLHNNNQQAWFVSGDFNEITNSGEKEGGRSRAPNQMMAFNLALSNCGLADMGFEGCPFTWSNNRKFPKMVRCRLDRVCASQFPTAHVSHIEQLGSDHIPIMLTWERTTGTSTSPRRRPFRFEAMWVRRPDSEDIVRKVWEEGSNGDQAYDTVFKGESCRAKLMQWSQDINPNKLIDRTQERIMELKRSIQTEDVRTELTKLVNDLEILFRDQSEY